MKKIYLEVSELVKAYEEYQTSNKIKKFDIFIRVCEKSLKQTHLHIDVWVKEMLEKVSEGDWDKGEVIEVLNLWLNML